MRSNLTDVDKRIQRKCSLAMTDEKEMAALGGKLLEIFHDVCSCNTSKANDTLGEICYSDGEYYDPCEEMRVMEESLIKLEYFTTDSKRDRYEREIRSILQTGQMIRIMDALKCKVYSYGKYGPDFVSILSTCYMNSFEYTNEEASEVLNMSLSSFYRKKRRAVVLFGLSFLEYKAEIQGHDMMLDLEPDGSQLSMAI